MNTVVCRENSRYFSIEAPSNWTLEKIKIDGGVVTDEAVKRCDYALLAKEGKARRNFFFVELKGKDLARAIKQLESSIEHLPHLFCGYEERHARAVCSRVVPFITSSAQVAACRFKRRLGFDLLWYSQCGGERLGPQAR